MSTSCTPSTGRRQNLPIPTTVLASLNEDVRVPKIVVLMNRIYPYKIQVSCKQRVRFGEKGDDGGGGG